MLADGKCLAVAVALAAALAAQERAVTGTVASKDGARLLVIDGEQRHR